MITWLQHRISKLSNDAQLAIVSSVLDVLPGTTFVSEEKANERLQECEKCSNLNKETRRCKICTCFIDEKTRVEKLPFMEPEKCPENKWL